MELGYIGTDQRGRSRSVPAWLGKVRHCLLVIPGEPALGIFEQFRGMFLKSRQLMEWVDVVGSASVDATHEQISDVSPVFGLEEQGLLPILNL